MELKGKAILTVVTALMLTSFLLPLLSESSSGGDIADLQDAAETFASGDSQSDSFSIDAGASVPSTSTIALPALKAYQTFTIRGNVTCTDGGTPGTLFEIDPGNLGTYVFSEMYILSQTSSGSEVTAIDDQSGGKVEVINVTFEDFLKVPIQAGKDLKITGSTFRECVGAIGVDTACTLNVTGCNFVNTTDTYVPMISSSSTEEVSITAEQCTFSGTGSTGAIYFNSHLEDPNNTLVVRKCLFIDEVNPSSMAIEVTGNFSGKIEIDGCQFKGMKVNGPAMIYVRSYTNVGLGLSMTGSTVDTCTSTGSPMLNVEGSPSTMFDVSLINSTFWDNTIESSFLEGCVYLTNCNAEIVHSTFFNNIWSDGTTYSPNSLKLGPDVNAVSVNSIYACDSEDGDGVVEDVPGSFTTYGDLRTEYAYGSEGLFMAEGLIMQGPSIGHGDNHPLETPYITPNAKDGHISADGYGMTQDELVAAGVNVTIPSTDQNGNGRFGRPDIGSVTIASAVLLAEGGTWNTDIVIEFPPYFHPDPSRVVSTSWDGTLMVPSDAVLNNDPLHLMGWSLSSDSKYPDSGLHYSEDTTGFSVDSVYFAKWGHLVTFDPGNGIDTDGAMVAPGDKVTFPAYGTVNGMKVSYWSTDAEGDARWDPSDGITGDVMLYAQWTDAQPPISTAEAVAATAVAAVAGAGAVGMAFTPTGSSSQSLIGTDGSGGADAQERNRRSVTFYPRNGRPAWTDFVIAGRVMTSPPKDPVHPEGKRFVGWATSRKGGTFFSLLSPINSSMVLYAIYEDNEKQ